LEGKEGVTVPEWVQELLPTSPSSPSTSKDESPDTLFLLLKLPPTPPKKQYHALDKSLPLDKLLRKKRFIEWPTVHVWLADEFEDGYIVGRERPDVQEDESPPYPYKKRKLNVQAGKKVLSGLVGGYASGSDDEDEDAEGESEEDPDADAEGEADGMIGLMEYDSGGEEISWAHVSKGTAHTVPLSDDDEVISWGEGDFEREAEQDERLLATIVSRVFPKAAQ